MNISVLETLQLAGFLCGQHVSRRCWRGSRTAGRGWCCRPAGSTGSGWSPSRPSLPLAASSVLLSVATLLMAKLSEAKLSGFHHSFHRSFGGIFLWRDRTEFPRGKSGFPCIHCCSSKSRGDSSNQPRHMDRPSSHRNLRMNWLPLLWLSWLLWLLW